MTTIVQTHWSGEMKFTACVDGHEIVMDADPEFGGSNEGRNLYYSQLLLVVQEWILFPYWRK